MFNFMCFLPVPQSQPWFLYMGTSHQQRLTITALGGMHTEPATEQWGGGAWGDAQWVLVMPIGRIHRQDIPRDPCMGFLMGVHKVASRFHVTFICSKPWLLFSQPLSLPQSFSSLQFSGWGKKEVSFFYFILYIEGNQALTLILSLFPMGEIIGWAGLSWPQAVSPWRRGDACRVEQFLLPFSTYPNLGYFCSKSVLVLLHWALRLPQSNSYTLSKFFEGKIIKNLFLPS